jgi:antagonist of KipI
VLPGPENTLFDKKSLVSFETNEYRIATASNRMGYRMEGPVLRTFQPVNLLSSGIVPGTIQVPPNGQPIVLLADAQTTGGYPRIGNVISADLPFLAQQKPGDCLRFRMVTLAQAHDLLTQKENMFAKVLDVD